MQRQFESGISDVNTQRATALPVRNLREELRIEKQEHHQMSGALGTNVRAVEASKGKIQTGTIDRKRKLFDPSCGRKGR
jgi:hypothetical protein